MCQRTQTPFVILVCTPEEEVYPCGFPLLPFLLSTGFHPGWFSAAKVAGINLTQRCSKEQQAWELLFQSVVKLAKLLLCWKTTTKMAPIVWYPDEDRIWSVILPAFLEREISSYLWATSYFPCWKSDSGRLPVPCEFWDEELRSRTTSFRMTETWFTCARQELGAKQARLKLRNGDLQTQHGTSLIWWNETMKGRNCSRLWIRRHSGFKQNPAIYLKELWMKELQKKKCWFQRTRGSYSEVASFSVGALECWEMGKKEKETKEDWKPVIESFQLLLKTFHELVTDSCSASSALFLWHTNALVPGPECSLWCFLREFFWGNTEEQEMVSF